MDIQTLEKNFVKGVLEIVGEVFGDIKAYASKERPSDILIQTTVVGDALSRIGAPIGSKAVIDPPLPWVLWDGSIEMKKDYFSRVLADEGSVRYVRSLKGDYVELSYGRSKNIERYLRPEHKAILEEIVDPCMKERVFPSGRKQRFIELSYAKRLLLDELERHPEKRSAINEILKLFESKSRAITDEQELLRNAFNIDSKLYGRYLFKGKLGRSLYYTLNIRRIKDLKIIRDVVRIDCEEKQRKLTKYLERLERPLSENLEEVRSEGIS